MRSRGWFGVAGLMLVMVCLLQDQIVESLSLPPLPLQTSGRYVVDATGYRVKFAGVNWYGFDSPDYVVGGLNLNTVDNIVKMIVDYGFNAIRIPWSLELFETNPVVNNSKLTANPDLHGLTALEILDQIIDALSNEGVLVMLDNHVSDASWCCSTDDDNGLWFNQRYSAEQWLSDWKGMVNRYKNVPAVVAVDLRNELRPNCAWYPGECLTPNWGGDNETLNWAAAAQSAGNELLTINPNLLIVVEGLNYATDLTAVQYQPINLDIPNRLVYEAHNYQWDYSFTDCDTLQANDLNPNWGYIAQDDIAPLFLGEFGACYTPQGCITSQSPWLECITWYLWNYDFDWFYWAIDGTESSGDTRVWGSPDTYGLFNTTWNGPSWPWFLQNKLQTMQQPRSLSSFIA